MKVSNCLLPKKFHASHSLCSALVDELEAFITEKDFLGLREQTINIDSEQKPLENESVLDYLIGIDERTLHDKCIENSIIHAILIDMIYFLKEALSASTKQRLTVTFALLRKPLVYDLVVLLRLFFTSDFLSRFNSEAGFDTTKLPKADLLELLDLSINTLISISITGEEIYDYIFNSDMPDSLINLSNQALHPSTTRSKNNPTGIQNMNFIFSTMNDIETQWEYLYDRLPTLLIYIVEVLDYIIFTQLKLDNDIYTARIEKRLRIFPR